MNTLTRTYNYTLKQYQRKGLGISCYFVDAYLNNRLSASIATATELSDTELERFFNVYLEREAKGDNATFLDSTENRMNRLYMSAKYNLSNLEHSLSNKMGKEIFETNYEKKCYYLMWTPAGFDREVQETFHISETYSPLSCLKMAHQMGEKKGGKYRILLSDHFTEVSPELLSFAINEF